VEVLVEVMDNRAAIREFLSSRRARITPEQAGLRVYGGTRRVPGLRREEVAMLAGVSADYYTRLERGNLGGVSETVLAALARALELDEAERAHLYDLARAASTSARPRRRPAQRVRPAVQRILDAVTGARALVRNGRFDILAANALGRALYSQAFENAVRTPNTARFLFLDPRSRDFFIDWDRSAEDAVAILRSEAGRYAHEPALSDLVGELSTRSEIFRTLWAVHDVRFHRTGVKRLHHPVAGALDVIYEALELPADGGLTMLVYTVEPGSRSAEGLGLLASWAATTEQAHGPAPAAGG
jgi:transcriptional regulator with XRE-family HTH domain